MSDPEDIVRRLKRLHAAHEEYWSLSESERAAHLESIHRDSPELAAELEKLIRQPDDPSLQQPLYPGLNPTADWPTEDPQRIGPYRILEKIGEGGMGIVYLAEQEKPIRRQVAIKIIKLGMDTKEVIGRFEAERQALAMMDHPGVARVFEAGATETGRPYFVMENVSGTTIIDYCDRHKLGIRDRLALFAETCRAVHHAHQKGIIHRDLKPSNILVGLRERKPESKIIDFGVAKAINQRLTEHTVYTEHGKIIGTPEYMSPEQAEMTGLNVDTSTDIYSLGVILYELLTGTLPVGSEVLRNSSWNAIQKAIREEDPPTPSARLAQAGTEPDDAAMRRGSDRTSLRKMITGELDWIVMKAIEKDRTRRYASATEFAQDIENFLAGEPVIAGPPGRTYRLKKTIAKHRTMFVAAASFVALLLVTVMLVSGLYLRSEKAREEVVAERDKAEMMGEFLLDLLGSANPYNLEGEVPTIDFMLNRAADQIASGELDDYPDTAARILMRIGRVYRLSGNDAIAERHCAAGLAKLEELYGADSDQLLLALCLNVHPNINLGRLEKAERLIRQGMTICEDKLAGNEMECADIMAYHAEFQRQRGNFAIAESLAARSIALFESIDDPYDASWIRLKQSHTFVETGRTEEAEVLVREAIVQFRMIKGEGTPEDAHSLFYLSAVHILARDYHAAEADLLDCVEIVNRRLGPDHPFLSEVFGRLGTVYRHQGRLEDSEAFYKRGLEIQQSVAGASPIKRIETLNGLGRLYTMLGRYQEADSILTICADLCGKSPAFYQRPLSAGQATRGLLHRKLGNDSRSDSLYAKALAFYDKTGIPNHPEAREIRREISDR